MSGNPGLALEVGHSEQREGRGKDTAEKGRGKGPGAEKARVDGEKNTGLNARNRKQKF